MVRSVLAAALVLTALLVVQLPAGELIIMAPFINNVVVGSNCMRALQSYDVCIVMRVNPVKLQKPFMPIILYLHKNGF